MLNSISRFRHGSVRGETTPQQQAYDMFHELWNSILPDGTRYCHWGGKSLTQRVVGLLKLHSKDCVLDLCCGRGGAIPFLSKADFVCGVDISLDAVRSANAWIGSSSRLCVQADAHDMPFKDQFFNKVLAQDGDAWLHPSKRKLMVEIFRVTAPNGLFVYQSYAGSKRAPQEILDETKTQLKKCGFIHTGVTRLEDIEEMFETAGFRIDSIRSLHKTYARDNSRMLNNWKKYRVKLSKVHPKHQIQALSNLLEWERKLFANRWWTGVLVIARKPSKSTVKRYKVLGSRQKWNTVTV